MTFLQPVMLFALPLMALPVAIHLLNRMRYQTRDWGAMMFLTRAMRQSSRLSRWRHWLLLLLRTVAVALLVLAVSRPVASELFGWSFRSVPETVVLVVDRSASMATRQNGSGPTTLQKGVEKIAATLQSLGAEPNMVLIQSDDPTPREIAGPQALTDLDIGGATGAAASIPALLRVAADFIGDTALGNAEVWIVSDAQTSSWRTESGVWEELRARFAALNPAPAFRFLRVETATETNRSIELLSAVREFRSGEDAVRLRFRIADFAKRGGAIPVTMGINGRSRRVDIPLDGREVTVTRLLPVPRSTSAGWGALALPEDPNRLDNTAYFVFGSADTVKTVVVAADPECRRLLSLAAAPDAASARYHVESSEPGVGALPDLGDVSLIVWQGRFPVDSEAVLEFVRSGGALLCLPPSRGDEGGEFADGFGWGRDQGAESAENEFRVHSWARQSGPLADAASGAALPLARLRVHRLRAPFGPVRPLAELEGGGLLAGSARIGAGQAVFLSTLPAEGWSNLSEGTVLVPLMRRLALRGNRRLQNIETGVCGQWHASARDGQVEPVAGPAGADPGKDPGVYLLGGRRIALNPAPREFTQPRLADEEVKALFGDLDLHLLRRGYTARASGSKPLARGAFCVAFLFLLVEGALMVPAAKAKGGR